MRLLKHPNLQMLSLMPAYLLCATFLHARRDVEELFLYLATHLFHLFFISCEIIPRMHINFISFSRRFFCLSKLVHFCCAPSASQVLNYCNCRAQTATQMIVIFIIIPTNYCFYYIKWKILNCCLAATVAAAVAALVSEKFAGQELRLWLTYSRSVEQKGENCMSKRLNILINIFLSCSFCLYSSSATGPSGAAGRKNTFFVCRAVLLFILGVDSNNWLRLLSHFACLLAGLYNKHNNFTSTTPLTRAYQVKTLVYLVEQQSWGHSNLKKKKKRRKWMEK